MSTVEESIEINVPVRTAYDQWTQFETFPQFMEGVTEVQQLDDTHLHWVADIGGVHREWMQRSPSSIPTSESLGARRGADNAGVVTFHKLSDTKTKVMLQLEFDPEGFTEVAGDKLGFVKRSGSRRPRAVQGLHRGPRL